MSEEPVVIDAGMDTGAPDVGDVATDDTGDTQDVADVGVDAGDVGDVSDDGGSDTGADGGSGGKSDTDKTPLTFDELVKQVDALKATNPKLARELRRQLFTGSRLAKHFDTPEAAEQGRQIIERLSGTGENPADRLNDLEKAQSDLEMIEQAIESGDVDFIHGIFEANPDGASNMVLPALSNLYKLNPQKYQSITAPILYNSYRAEGGPISVFSKVYQALKSQPELASNPTVQQALAEMDKFGGTFQQLEDFIRKSQDDPLKSEREKLATRTKELDTQADKNFNSLLDGQILPIRNNLMEQQLKPYLQGISSDREKYIRESVIRELAPLWENDTVMQKQYGTLLKTKDANRIVRFVESKLKTHIPTAVNTVVKHFGLTLGKKAASTAKTGAGRTQVRADRTGTNPNGQQQGTKDNPFRFEPKAQDIDTRRTSTFMRLHGEAVDKRGRYYKWV
jgi:hypothetical protein